MIHPVGLACYLAQPAAAAAIRLETQQKKVEIMTGSIDPSSVHGPVSRPSVMGRQQDVKVGHDLGPFSNARGTAARGSGGGVTGSREW